jgi:hypothetical protein
MSIRSVLLRQASVRARTLPYNAQGYIRNQVEQEDSYLEDRYPDVILGIELFDRQAKPPSSDPIYPIVCKREEQKPDQEQSVINRTTPQQEFFRHLDVHVSTSPSGANS